MSTVKANTFQDASGGNTATINSMTPTADSLQGFRNRIINGDMRIDQRNAGASINITNSVVYTVDRFYGIQAIASSKFSAQQSSTAPTGFTKSVICTSSSAYTVLSSDYFLYRQVIEGFNVADLDWGSANAKTITLSFWVRSSLTGTFGGSLSNGTSNRSYPFSYTISSANTWEQKAITITGDTTGTWATDNSAGIFVNWSMGMGSTYTGTLNTWAGAFYGAPTGSTDVVSTNGATFYITGVQLEVGSVATPFERRPYGTELQLCQRYYCKSFSTETAPAQNTGYTGALFAISVNAGANSALIVNWQFPIEMRAVPTITTFSPAAANANWYSPAGPSSTTTVGTFGNSTRFANIYNTNAPAAGADIVYYIQATAAIEL